MISKEEHQKTLVRMFNSVRDNDDDMGKPSCAGVSCRKCPLYFNDDVCESKIYNAYDIISIVEEWGKEHPSETNGSKFLKNYPSAKVLGYTNRATVGYNVRVVLDSSKPADKDNVIELSVEWWNEEVE